MIKKKLNKRTTIFTEPLCAIKTKNLITDFRHIFLFLTFTPVIVFGQSSTFSKEMILEDLTYLHSVLIEKHPNINIYSTEEEFSNFFKNITIEDNVTELEAYNLISKSNKVIKDGHTLFYPNRKWIENNNANKLFIPLQPFWDGSKLYVSKSYSSTGKLEKGTQIISINGIKSPELIQEMLSKMMRDGDNYNYPTWVLNTYFYEYFSYFYGCSEEYQINFYDGLEEKSLTIKGISKPELFKQIRKHQEPDEKGITLAIDEEKSIGVLTIKDWHNNILKKFYGQEFIPEIKKAIEQIKDKGIQNLIIDVRNNQGGDTRNSKYLLTYLLNEPFVLVEQYYRKKKGIIVECNGPQSGLHQPMSQNFKGNIYVLINGGSFSNTGIFCSVLRKHKRAIFIGEETGGSEFVICGSPKNITLPNTAIQIELPQLQFMIKTNEENELHSVIPDYYIEPKIDYIVEQKDKDLEFTIELISKSTQQGLKRQ